MAEAAPEPTSGGGVDTRERAATMPMEGNPEGQVDPVQVWTVPNEPSKGAEKMMVLCAREGIRNRKKVRRILMMDMLVL